MWHFLRNFIHWQWKFRHLLWNITLTQKLVLSSGLMIFGVNFNKGRDQRGEESKFVWHYSNSGHIFRLSTGTKNSPPLFFQLPPPPSRFISLLSTLFNRSVNVFFLLFDEIPFPIWSLNANEGKKGSSSTLQKVQISGVLYISANI